jgi:alanine-glyoxylate transaminase / serine-glyoxylate transaminase / serine-pyruvate transaminase
MSAPSGRHFLQIPGPTNVPDSILGAISAPTIDHRGPAFRELATRIQHRIGAIFGTVQPVIVYPSSGTGAWEAALVNTLSPGDEVLCFGTGHFAALWADIARRLGLVVHVIEADWRRGVDPAHVEARLADDRAGRLRAVMVVHNETSTGVTSRIPEIRAAIDATGHHALLLVDTISSLGSIRYEHDAWGVDVTVAGSQKGLMLPPGLSFNAISPRALTAAATATMPRAYWDWTPMLEANAAGMFPYTPATNLLYGLDVALDRLEAEGLDNVLARHARHAAATRAAVEGWGLEVYAADPREYSNALTAVVVPEGVDADDIRRIILERFDMSLGAGLSKLAGRVFRIGHLGDFNDLMLAGTLSGVQMGLRLAGVPADGAGLERALAVLERP